MTCDGEPVWYTCGDESITVAELEQKARKRNGDWCIEIQGPLNAAYYQRHGEGVIARAKATTVPKALIAENPSS
ncbi:MAG: hypothetical protein ACRDUV_06535 [Pseudonocardiaceae bacterium]